MKTIAESLTALCNFVISVYFVSIVMMVFDDPHERFFPHHIILTFGVLWIITQIISYANYEGLTNKQ